ncbi:MAG: dephospho-CoA kinase [Candidatus Omnitrophica bacterium]|nr:dephospho-CoA kinase [Candidatus Omnitrophota bacterium]MDD5027710.1 dephospho-CoA kinase [Candidatus Omnitrophota bacterium]MDD5662023.1 dephospho-CoA kinase [Candidatus Omnitrophota bacterium]
MPRLRKNKKIIVGLTGSFGSGKSTVAGIFASSGAKVIDADRIAHAFLRRGSKVYEKVVYSFGPGILGKNKEIDRRRLAGVVFNNKKYLKRLNAIIHPEVIRIIKAKINSIEKGVIILDAPLLLEANLKSTLDCLIVVKTDRDKQFSRLIKKTSLKRADILKRIKSQISQQARERLADFIINNSGSLTNTRKQVAQIRRKLWKN